MVVQEKDTVDEREESSLIVSVTLWETEVVALREKSRDPVPVPSLEEL